MLRRRIAAAAVSLLTLGGMLGVEAQPRRLKVHISVDMEGIAGVVTGEQLGPTGFESAPTSLRSGLKRRIGGVLL